MKLGEREHNLSLCVEVGWRETLNKVDFEISNYSLKTTFKVGLGDLFISCFMSPFFVFYRLLFFVLVQILSSIVPQNLQLDDVILSSTLNFQY